MMLAVVFVFVLFLFCFCFGFVYSCTLHTYIHTSFFWRMGVFVVFCYVLLRLRFVRESETFFFFFTRILHLGAVAVVVVVGGG